MYSYLLRVRFYEVILYLGGMLLLEADLEGRCHREVASGSAGAKSPPYKYEVRVEGIADKVSKLPW